MKKEEVDLEKLKETKIPTRRVRMLMVQPADFMSLFTKGLVFNKRTELLEGIPDDAKLITLAPDSVRNGVMLVVESSEYEAIPINVLPPVQAVQIHIGVKNATKAKKTRRKK